GDARAAVVRSVLTQGQAAIQFQVIYGGEAAVFIGNAACPLFKFLGVLGSPPVAQIAFGIEFAAFIVKAIGELVANHQANSAHVDRVIHGAIKEGWLQDAGGKNDLVVAAAVVGIDRRRRHAPFQLVYGLADLL